MGINIVFLFMLLVHAHVFFICAVVFFEYITKTVSRLSRLYPLLFAIKILIVSQSGDM